MIQGCTNQIKALEFTPVSGRSEAVQEWWGPFRLTLRWASQPKGDCKVSHHSSQLCVFSALFIFNLDKNETFLRGKSCTWCTIYQAKYELVWMQKMRVITVYFSEMIYNYCNKSLITWWNFNLYVIDAGSKVKGQVKSERNKPVLTRPERGISKARFVSHLLCVIKTLNIIYAHIFYSSTTPTSFSSLNILQRKKKPFNFSCILFSFDCSFLPHKVFI